jgi:hypothetical protein
MQNKGYKTNVFGLDNRVIKQFIKSFKQLFSSIDTQHFDDEDKTLKPQVHRTMTDKQILINQSILYF